MTRSSKDEGSLFVTPQAGRKIYTVSEIAKDIKLILEESLGQVWVAGEISNFQAAASGHFYFTLKDDSSVLPAAMFVHANKDIKFKPESGISVICFGKISAYPGSGKYQIIVEKIEPKGLGALQLGLEQLKKKLEAEGLFSREHKRPIPYLPSKIAVVTSLQGAAVKDILKVLGRRFSGVNIIIRSAQVQGEAAKEDIAQAINDFNNFNAQLADTEKIEVMIVGRGGGSIEDLWAFNEEIVARAIYNSKIPVISAVGHERDWTIADLVADMRAPTPSAAAEIVIPEKEELKQRLNNIIDDLKGALSDLLNNFIQAMDDLLHRLKMQNPKVQLDEHKIKLQDLARQINVRLEHYLKLRYAQFAHSAGRLEALSPLNILGRGYSITFRMPEGSVVKNISEIKAGDIIKTRLQEGQIISKVTEAGKNG